MIKKIIICDGDVTPREFEVPLWSSLTWTPGGFTEIPLRDQAGNFTGCVVKGEANATSFSITGTQCGVGAQLFDEVGPPPPDPAIDVVALIDFIHTECSPVMAPFVSADACDSDTCGSTVKLFTVKVYFEGTGTETNTLYQFDYVSFQGSSFSSALEGNTINLSGTSYSACPTITSDVTIP